MLEVSMQSKRNNTTSAQLDLLFSYTESSLKNYLEEGLGKPVSLILTDNSTSMLSASVHSGFMRVRLHRMFLNSSREALDEIVSFLKSKRGKMQSFHKFIRDNREHLERKPQKKISIKTSGKFYDLCALYDEINEEYFGGLIKTVITWGSSSPRFSVRKRTLGSYSARSNTIRINPVLDKKNVPRCYIAFVVYHEMLHADMGICKKGERRSIHSRDFRKREKLFQDYEKAMAWERGVKN